MKRAATGRAAAELMQNCESCIWRQGMDGCPVPLAILGEQAHQLLLLTDAAAR